MNWRKINKSESDILIEAARFELSFPRFYREASQVWTASEEAVLEFYRSCDPLYGIFDNIGSDGVGKYELIGLVYLQSINEWHKVAHLDSKRGADQEQLLTGICRIRNDLFRQGIKQIQTWVLRRNTVLQQMLFATGFKRTGLEMRAGMAHGRTLRWMQMTVGSLI